jgi:transketolase
LQQFKLLKKTQHKLANEYLAISKNQYAFKNRWFAKTPHVENEATRNIVGNIIQTVFTNQPTFITVNPDLSSSTKIIADGKNITSATPTGKNLNIGVREFVGADIVNGIVAHGGTRAVCATFLSFSDYNKAAVRLGAISQLPILNVYTHDSITVGEDGPTHQPIEQIPALRLIPNHYLFRPANFAEALFAIKFYLKNKKSAISIISSRSAFKQIVGDATQIKFGGYCLIDQPEYDLTIIATGSEVGLADEVIACLAKKQIKARLVSMPCVELFRQSPLTHQNAVLGNKPRISLEFAATAP